MKINEFIPDTRAHTHRKTHRLVYAMEVLALRGDSILVETVGGKHILINRKNFKADDTPFKPEVGGWVFIDHIQTSKIRMFEISHAVLQHQSKKAWNEHFNKIGK